MKVLILEPGMDPRVADIDNTLEAMQEVVGGFIEVVPQPFFQDDIVMICKEEGKLLGLQPCAVLRDSYNIPYDIVCGTCFLCTAPVDSEDFEGLTQEQIRRCLYYYA